MARSWAPSCYIRPGLSCRPLMGFRSGCGGRKCAYWRLRRESVAAVSVRRLQECVRRAREAGAPAVTLHTTDMMRVAIRLYERLGFVAAPELDFHPAPGLTVKGYQLRLAGC